MMKYGFFTGIGMLAAVLFSAVSPANAADGPAVWKAQKCHSCHGDTGKADTKLGKKLNVSDMTTAEWQKSFTDDQIKKAITDGVDREKDGKRVKMKAYKKLGADEVDALLALIRSWGPK